MYCLILLCTVYFCILFSGSNSRSEDITPVPSKSKNDTKGSTASKTSQSNVAKPAPRATPLVSETIKKEILSTEVTQLSQSVTNIESSTTETIVQKAVEENETHLPEFLVGLLNEIAEKEGFSDYTFDVSFGSNHGDGFLAVIKRVIVSGTRSGQKDKLPLICKLMPTSQARRDQFNSDAVFIREAFMYSVVLPAFSNFQNEKGLTVDDGFHEYPKCYGTLDDKENDRFVIVLEDLKDSGYEMFDKFKAADFNHVKLFAESLGKLHGVSFAFKDQRPDDFVKFTHMKDVFIQQVLDKPEVMVPMFSFFFDKSIAAFKPEEEVEIKALTKMKENVEAELLRTGSGESSEPFSIINHGDCWNNNMMYCYGTEKNVPVKISLLDYQISRYSSPALDLVYFLFSSTDKALRSVHYTEIMKLYHKSLSTVVTKLGSDADKVFSYDDLQNQLKKFGCYALIIAPMLLNIITARPDDIPALDNFAEEYKDKSIVEGMKAFMSDAPVEKFNERIRDVVQDVLRLGYYE